MLIKCPKCGFSQPKDHYCAQCGVNIEKFTPVKENLAKVFFSNLFVQMSLVTLVAGLTITYFFNSQDLARKNAPTYRKKIYSSLSKTYARSDTVNQISKPKQDADSSETIVVEPKSDQEKNALIAHEENKPNAQIINRTDTQNNPAMNNQQVLHQNIPLYLSFYEIDRSLLNYWIKGNTEQINSDDQGEVRSGQILMTQFRQQVRDKSLLTENKKLGLKKKTSFLFGLHSENLTLFTGLQLELQIETVRSDQISALLVISKLIPATLNSSAINRKINIKIDIKKDHMFYIHWKDDLDGFHDNAEIQKQAPFHIFKSSKYAARKSDFVFILYSDFIFNQSSFMNTKEKSIPLISARNSL